SRSVTASLWAAAAAASQHEAANVRQSRRTTAAWMPAVRRDMASACDRILIHSFADPIAARQSMELASFLLRHDGKRRVWPRLAPFVRSWSAGRDPERQGRMVMVT